MSTEQTESFQEQLSRVEQMAEGDSATWDLSDNDVAALQAVLADRQRMAKRLNESASSSSEGASLAALQQKLARREHEITEGGEMRDSLRDEIAVLEQRLAEVTRHLTEAQEQLHVSMPESEHLSKELFIRKQLLGDAPDPKHPPTAEMARLLRQRAEAAEATIATLRDALTAIVDLQGHGAVEDVANSYLEARGIADAALAALAANPTATKGND